MKTLCTTTTTTTTTTITCNGLIPVAVRTEVSVCGRSIPGNGGSNLAEGMDVRSLCCCVSCVGSDLCDGLITRSES